MLYVVKIIFCGSSVVCCLYIQELFLWLSICTQDGLYQILWFCAFIFGILSDTMVGLPSSPYKEMYFGCVHVLVVCLGDWDAWLWLCFSSGCSNT